jgi:hypothetical protein
MEILVNDKVELKRNVLKSVLTLTLLTVLFFSCNQQPKNETKEIAESEMVSNIDTNSIDSILIDVLDSNNNKENEKNSIVRRYDPFKLFNELFDIKYGNPTKAKEPENDWEKYNLRGQVKTVTEYGFKYWYSKITGKYLTSYMSFDPYGKITEKKNLS